MDEKIKEFEVSMVCYHPENKYTLDEFNDMFIEFIESKGMWCGGRMKLIEDKE